MSTADSIQVTGDMRSAITAWVASSMPPQERHWSTSTCRSDLGVVAVDRHKRRSDTLFHLHHGASGRISGISGKFPNDFTDRAAGDSSDDLRRIADRESASQRAFGAAKYVLRDRAQMWQLSRTVATFMVART